MATEPQGPGYQAPPSGGLRVPEEERLRAIEDFLSRRIKAKVKVATKFTVPGAGYFEIPLGTIEYDTAGLWPGSGARLIIPPGAEGDYLFIAQFRAGPNAHECAIDTSAINSSAIEHTVLPAPNSDVQYSLAATATMKPGDYVRLLIRRLVPDETPSAFPGTSIEIRRLV